MPLWGIQPIGTVLEPPQTPNAMTLKQWFPKVLIRRYMGGLSDAHWSPDILCLWHFSVQWPCWGDRWDISSMIYSCLASKDHCFLSNGVRKWSFVKETQRLFKYVKAKSFNSQQSQGHQTTMWRKAGVGLIKECFRICSEHCIVQHIYPMFVPIKQTGLTAPSSVFHIWWRKCVQCGSEDKEGRHMRLANSGRGK